MKRSITILFFTTISIVLFSINVKANEESWDPEGDRSISLFLSIDENELHIYSEKQWDNIDIQVQDSNGTIIYINRINIPAEEELAIPLLDIPESNYQVTLTKDNKPITWYLTK